MTSRKILTATAILALVAGATAADAAPRRRKPAPKPVCKIIQDAPNDATEMFATAGPTDPALDIVSADIVTDATRVTAVWRLTSLAGSPTGWPFGRGYQISFKAKTGTAILQAVIAPNGNLWQNGQGTGVVETAKNEVRLTVPQSALTVKFKPGERLTELVATTWRTSGNTEIKVGRVDNGNAVAPFYYTAGYPSCVRVGA